MRNFKLMMLGTAVVLGFTTPAAMAAEKNYNLQMPRANKSVAMQNYLNYEEREPCQNYRIPPAGFYYEGCNLMKRRPQVVAQAEPAMAVAKIEPTAGNEMAVYKVNFAYDKSGILPSDNVTLDQIAYDIKKYNPREVIVSGYTDTAGTSDYNQKLSQRRADSVSMALDYRGINSKMLNKKAYGERNLAVETNDGVPLQDNRRAVIQFVK